MGCARRREDADARGRMATYAVWRSRGRAWGCYRSEVGRTSLLWRPGSSDASEPGCAREGRQKHSRPQPGCTQSPAVEPGSGVAASEAAPNHPAWTMAGRRLRKAHRRTRPGHDRSALAESAPSKECSRQDSSSARSCLFFISARTPAVESSGEYT